MSFMSSSLRIQRRKMVSTSLAGAAVFFPRHSQAASSAMKALLCSGSMKCFPSSRASQRSTIAL